MKRDVSDKVIIVSEYDPLSAAGVERLKALFADDLAYERVWVLLNKMLPDIAERYGEFLEVARYLPPIPWSADVVRAYSRRSLALDLDHGNDYTVAVTQTLMASVGPATATELKKWLTKKASDLRTPIITQIHELKGELEAVAEREHRRETIRLGVLLSLISSALVASIFGVLSVLANLAASSSILPIALLIIVGVLD